MPLKTCCCFCFRPLRLETACKLIGIVYMVIHAICMVAFCAKLGHDDDNAGALTLALFQYLDSKNIKLYDYDKQENKINLNKQLFPDDAYKRLKPLNMLNIGNTDPDKLQNIFILKVGGLQYDKWLQDAVQLLQHVHTMWVLRLISAFLFVLFSALLVAGVYLKKRRLVMAFEVFYVLHLLVMTVLTMYAFYDRSVLVDEMTFFYAWLTSGDGASGLFYAALVVMLLVLAFSWYLAVVVYSYYREMSSRPTTAGKP